MTDLCEKKTAFIFDRVGSLDCCMSLLEIDSFHDFVVLFLLNYYVSYLYIVDR